MSTSRRLGLVLGDQLSFDLSLFKVLDPGRDILLMAEVRAEATYVPHHLQKIVLVFSAMRHFASALRERGWHVVYVTLDDPANTGSLKTELERHALLLDCHEVHVTECGEWRLQEALGALGLPLRWHQDARFFCSRDEFAQWAADRRQIRMEHFYRHMRRKTGYLLEQGAPAGSAWNHDKENRRSLPPGQAVPAPASFDHDDITRAVIALVSRCFPAHPGEAVAFDYPVTHAQAGLLWSHFLDFALAGFGDFQDAMALGEPYLFHARISAALNIGLLDVRTVCDDVEAAYRRGHVPLNAAEGFIRQLVGWREYVRGIYWLRMPAYKRLNALGNQRSLPGFYWTGDTRMRCVKEVIRQTMRHGYAHHIQRLMVTGNFALLAGILPSEICDWYLSVYLDAYEWVELPNTLGMVMHADAGYLGSKPYCASGRYIARMSDYCDGCHYRVDDATGDKACPFNALYWHFLIRHTAQLSHNPRLAMPYQNLRRMDPARLAALWQRGEHLLTRLDAGECI